MFPRVDTVPFGSCLVFSARSDEGAFVQGKKEPTEVAPTNSGDIIALALKKKFLSILSPQKDGNATTVGGDDWLSPPQHEKVAARQGNLVQVFPAEEDQENLAEPKPKEKPAIAPRKGAARPTSVVIMEVQEEVQADRPALSTVN